MTQIVPKRLQKIGGSTGFILPKKYRELLGWHTKTRLIFFVHDDALVVKEYVPPKPWSQRKEETE